MLLQIIRNKNIIPAVMMYLRRRVGLPTDRNGQVDFSKNIDIE
jgi:hypothetical protein